MDFDYTPVIIALLALAVVVVLLLVFFSLASRERTFEESYGQKAIEVLEDKAREKPKKDHAKKKAKPRASDKTTHERKETTDSDKAEKELSRAKTGSLQEEPKPKLETPEPVQEEVVVAENVQLQGVVAPPPKPKELKKKKKENLGVEASDHPQDPPQKAVLESESKSDVKEKVQGVEKEPEMETTPKPTKKRKHKNSDQVIKVEEARVTKSAAPQAKSTTTPSEPDLDQLMDKLQGRQNLNDSELSTLVEMLLTKQQWDSEKLDIEQKIAQYVSEISKKEHQLLGANQIVATANQKISDMERVCNEERQKFSAVDKRWRDELQQAKVKNTTLERQMHTMVQESQRLNENMQKMSQQANPAILEKLQKDLQERSRSLENQTHELHRLQRESAEIKQRQQHSENERQAVEEKLKAFQAAKDNDARRLTEAERNLEEKEQALVRYKSQTENLDRAYSELKDKIEQLMDQCKISSEQALLEKEKGDKAENELRRVESELMQAKKHLVAAESIQKSEPKLIVQNGSVLDGGDKSMEVVQKLRSDLATAKSDISAWEAKYDRLTTELLTTSQNKDKLEVELTNAKKEICDMDTLKSQIKDLTQQRDEAHSQLSALNQEKSSASSTVDDLKQRLKKVEADKNQAQENAGKSLREKEQQLEKADEENKKKGADLSSMEEKLKNATTLSTEFDSKLTQVRTELVDLMAKSEELEKENSELKGQLVTAVNGRSDAERRLDELKREVQSRELERSPEKDSQGNEKKMDTDVDVLQKKIEDYECRIVQLVEKHYLEMQGVQGSEEPEKSKKESKKEAKKQQKKQQSATPIVNGLPENEEFTELQKLYEEQRAKNQELRQRNEKILDAVTKTEQNTKQVIDSVLAKMKANNHAVFSTMKKLCPETKLPQIDDKTELPDWLSKVEEQSLQKASPTQTIKEAPSVATEPSMKQLAKSQFEEKAVEEISDRLACIADVAEANEKKWQNLCLDLEKALVQEKKKSKENSSTCVSEKERVISELKEKVTNLSKSLESSHSEIYNFKEQVIFLEKQLESERSGGRDLSAQVVKLRGMLKTGQDALSYEQRLVLELQRQLEERNASEDPSFTGVHSELERVRTVLSDREKQLETERHANKEMANKLASMGVAP